MSSLSSSTKRAIWPSLLPEFSSWSATIGLLLGAMSIILTGISGLTWQVTVATCLIVIVVPTLAYALWKIAYVIWQRVQQYDLLCNDLEEARSKYQKAQENIELFLKLLHSAGAQIFEVTSAEWGNKSPFLVIDCNQSVPPGSKLTVLNRFTLDTVGSFEVVQPTIDGYLLRKRRILNIDWWNCLDDEVAKCTHPRIVDAVAILLN
jgi:hypothetical protein